MATWRAQDGPMRNRQDGRGGASDTEYRVVTDVYRNSAYSSRRRVAHKVGYGEGAVCGGDARRKPMHAGVRADAHRCANRV